MALDSGPFRVAVKDSAAEANAAARRLAAAEGEVVGFDSRRAAERRAESLSEAGETPVAIQRAAPQDDAEVDAYLVASPERRRREPEGTPTEGLTFDTGANQYGALGEAVVLSPSVDPPVLVHVARLDPDRPDDPRVELDRDPDPVVVGPRARWEPDCRAVVRAGPDRPVAATYWCEVKAGDASLERSQRAAMEAKAREATVLEIRVALGDLPDSYTARVRRVEPDEDAAAGSGSRIDASLEDF